MEAKELHFCIHDSALAGEEEGGYVITFAPVEYWKENRCLPDYFFSDQLADELVPEGYAWVMGREETIWFTCKSKEEIREELTKAGFVESVEMERFLTPLYDH